VPYDEAFGYVGLRLTRTQSRDPFIGIAFDFENRTKLVIGNIRNGSPAEDAGLQRGDEIMQVAERAVTRDNWLSTLERYQPGDTIPIKVKRDRRTIQSNVVLGKPNRFEYRIEDRKDATAEQKALFVAWMKGS
jgi:predicted metalloprotease with PDZ domain